MRLDRTFTGLLAKEWYVLWTRKKQFFAFLLLPLIVAGIFLILFDASSSSLRVGVCDLDGSTFVSDAFSSEFTVTNFPGACEDELTEAVRASEIDVGILVPERFSQSLEDFQRAEIVVLSDQSDLAFSQFLEWKVHSLLKQYTDAQVVSTISTAQQYASRLPRSETFSSLDPQFVVNPVYISMRGVSGDFDTKSASFPYVFVIVAWLLTLMLVSTGYLYDVHSGFVSRVKSAGVLALYVLAKILFYTAVVAVQFILVFLLFLIAGGSFIYSTDILWLIVFVGSSTTLLGLLIGTFTDSEGSAMLVSLLISFPLILLSGAFMPLQSTPSIIRFIVSTLPMQAHITAVKNVVLIGNPISFSWVISTLIAAAAIWYLVRRD